MAEEKKNRRHLDALDCAIIDMVNSKADYDTEVLVDMLDAIFEIRRCIVKACESEEEGVIDA